jgi:hypothetical protein
MAIPTNPFVAIEEEIVIAAGPARRHRAFPTGVRLPNGDLLVGYRDGSDHHMTCDGAFHITRSTDNGKHWTPPKVLAAFPGWDVCAAMGQYTDGVMGDDEPFLWARLQLYRWQFDAPDDDDLRTYETYWTISYDHGHNWEKPFPFEAGPVSTIQTDRGEMTLEALAPHSYSSTLARLSDGSIMGMFVGNKLPAGQTRSLKYRHTAANFKAGKNESAITEVSLAGFSKDNMRTWEYVAVSDPDDEGLGGGEADLVQLDSDRLVVIYGNVQGTSGFLRTFSDDLGRTWSKREPIAAGHIGDSLSMIKLADGSLIAAIRNSTIDDPGIGLLASNDGGETWQLLGNMLNQGSWDMGYPDLIRLADGGIFCVFYTSAEAIQISPEVDKCMPRNPIFTGMRQRAYEELNGEIRGIFLKDITAIALGATASSTDEVDRKNKLEL